MARNAPRYNEGEICTALGIEQPGPRALEIARQQEEKQARQAERRAQARARKAAATQLARTRRDFCEANRVLFVWGPAQPIVSPDRRLRGEHLLGWQGCRETREDGYACMAQPNDGEVCWRHRQQGGRPSHLRNGGVETVYFIAAQTGDGEWCAVKIGRAIDPLSRLATLQGASPLPLELVRAVTGPVGLESALHTRFAKARTHGEWFEPTVELIDFVLGSADEDILAVAQRRQPPTPEDLREAILWARWQAPDYVRLGREASFA